MWFQEADRDPNDLGGGLTHELSKYLASGLLEDALTEPQPQFGVIWDACGRLEPYVHWIEMALDNGYEVEVVYVYCPAKVALRRAASRRRKLDPAIVEATHRRAAEVAVALETHVADLKVDGCPISFRAVQNSTPAEEAAAE